MLLKEKLDSLLERLRSRKGLGQTDPGLRMQHLPLQIGQLDGVMINDTNCSWLTPSNWDGMTSHAREELTHACGGQILKSRTA